MEQNFSRIIEFLNKQKALLFSVAFFIGNPGALSSLLTSGAILGAIPHAVLSVGLYFSISARKNSTKFLTFAGSAFLYFFTMKAIKGGYGLGAVAIMLELIVSLVIGLIFLAISISRKAILLQYLAILIFVGIGLRFSKDQIRLDTQQAQRSNLEAEAMEIAKTDLNRALKLCGKKDKGSIEGMYQEMCAAGVQYSHALSQDNLELFRPT